MRYWRYDPNSETNFDPRFRKATTMMKILVTGLENVFSGAMDERLDRNSTEVFLGSRHGEIESTFNYLKGLSQNKVGRPFLFQNSLHHSTTGFVSQQFQLLGPTYSLCVIEQPQVEIMMTALIQALRNRSSVLMVHTESFPKEMADITDFEMNTQCEFLYLDKKAMDRIDYVRSSDCEDLKVDNFKSLFEALKAGRNFNILQSGIRAHFTVKSVNDVSH